MARNDRSFDGSIHIPSARPNQATAESFLFNASLAGKLGKGVAIAFVLEMNIGGAIVALLKLCCPDTISWFVALIIINSFNAVLTVAARTFAHIGEKVLE